MDRSHPRLGLCFFNKQLFYAINGSKDHKFTRIGSVDFNFDVTEAILSENEFHFPGIRQSIARLRQQHKISHVRMLSFPAKECWTILPRLVYDNADERKAHINILMNGLDRKNIEPTWHNLSNQDYRFLLLRNTEISRALKKLSPDASTTDLVSEFELGGRWIQHTEAGGSFMTICCFKNCISVTSYILGKLRGATYITFDEAEDLPYLWLQQTQELSWMQGLHEEIHIYGSDAYRIVDILRPFWDEAGTVIKMDSLKKMNIQADEDTYSFNLELAYPAILLALN